MARLAREISETGIYHVVFRGVNKQHIFEEVADYEKMVNVIIQVKNDLKFEIYAYCFMSNHVHIILKEQEQGQISLIMKRILTKYARWYNIKYKRSGALIANRYKSKAVANDEYFIPLIRYIHQNPVKAGIVENLIDYKWSSYEEYFSEKINLIDKEFVLDMLTLNQFKEIHEEESNEIFTVDDRIKLSDDEVRRLIIKKYKIEPKNIGSMPMTERNTLLKELKTNFSIRQLERVTGVSRGIIYKS